MTLLGAMRILDLAQVAQPEAPEIQSATLTGQGRVNQPMACAVSATGVPTPSIAYQWKRGGSPLPGATGQTYTPLPADAEGVLTCSVTATNSEGVDSLTSNAVTIAAFNPPVYTQQPTLTGDGTLDSQLVATQGQATNSPFYSYTWEVNGVTMQDDSELQGGYHEDASRLNFALSDQPGPFGTVFDVGTVVRYLEQAANSDGVASATPQSVTVAAAPTGPNPGAYAPLILWATLRDDGLAQGQLITQYTDKSGNGRHLTQVTTSAQALLQPGPPPAGEFDGSDRYFNPDRAGAASILTSPTGGTITLVVKGSQLNLNNRSNILFGCTTYLQKGWFVNVDSQGGAQNSLRMGLKMDSGAVHYTSSNSHVLGPLSGGWHVIEISFAPNNDFTVWLDGVQVGGVTTTSDVKTVTPTHDLALGSYPTGANGTLMTLSDALLHTGQVTDHLAYAQEFLP